MLSWCGSCFDLRADIIALGIDRLDYTKGINERLDELDVLMAQRPDLCGRLIFVGMPKARRSSRDERHIPGPRRYADDADDTDRFARSRHLPVLIGCGLHRAGRVAAQGDWRGGA
ncbi:MAG: hypothetical protein EHM55_15570 [Acidobacteria bacterium]|nr:MAG: hypothetical protein EHM55_15570 [Acidobacteriota bacterium]